MSNETDIVRELGSRFETTVLSDQVTCDAIPTVWIEGRGLRTVLEYLKYGIDQPYRMLYDLTCIDERLRCNRRGLPDSDFTLVYHLLSYDRNQDMR